jgi:hypothetical protein
MTMDRLRPAGGSVRERRAGDAHQGALPFNAFHGRAAGKPR